MLYSTPFGEMNRLLPWVPSMESNWWGGCTSCSWVLTLLLCLTKWGWWEKQTNQLLQMLCGLSIPQSGASHDVQHVLDGGPLLQRLPWPRGTTYSAIAKLYTDYVQKKYGRSTNMVFDGYEGGPLTKDSTPINAAVKGMLNQQSTLQKTWSVNHKRSISLLTNQTNKRWSTS